MECHRESATMRMVFGPCVCPACTGLPMPDRSKWKSNPYAYGAIGYYPDGKKVGGVSNVGRVVKGYVGSRCVYEGDDEEMAMRHVERRCAGGDK